MKIFRFFGISITWLVLAIGFLFLLVGAVVLFIFFGFIYLGVFLIIGILFLISWIFFSRKKHVIKQKTINIENNRIKN